MQSWFNLGWFCADYVSYTNPPKYVCPRDHVKTCSLPCYKRHQQHATCNGKRDPTAYVKRDQLATASGIDHDYNFLSGVERVFDRADKDREVRGIGEVDTGTRKRWNNHGPLQKYLRQNNIFVDRAPLGMSRQKANTTRLVQKSKKIVWTVEWVHDDGTKTLSDVHEAATVGDAYASLLAERERESKKRKRSSSLEAPLKRKDSEDSSQVDQPANQRTEKGAIPHNQPAAAPPGTDLAKPSSTPAGALPAAREVEDETPGAASDFADSSAAIDQTASSSAESQTQSETDTRLLILSRIQSEQSRQAALRIAKVPSGPPFFYLLRPHTTSTSRVLIPLFPENTVTTSLTDQTVLEFPTIHVLDQGEEHLGEGYITEDAYLAAKQEEDAEVEDMLRTVPGSAAGNYDKRGAEDGYGESGGGGALDPSKILEMLKRDVPV